jgi:hypothetical protein
LNQVWSCDWAYSTYCHSNFTSDLKNQVQSFHQTLTYIRLQFLIRMIRPTRESTPILQLGPLSSTFRIMVFMPRFGSIYELVPFSILIWKKWWAIWIHWKNVA